MRVASVTMYYSFQYGCLTALRMSHVLFHHVCGSLALRMPHTYCPTDITHTVLRMSPILSYGCPTYGCHPFCPTYITHTVLRISPILFYGYPTYTGYGCHPYCLTDVPPILSYGCPTYAVLRMSPMLSQHMSGSLALRMSQPYRPTGVIHIVSR